MCREAVVSCTSMSKRGRHDEEEQSSSSRLGEEGLVDSNQPSHEGLACKIPDSCGRCSSMPENKRRWKAGVLAVSDGAAARVQIDVSGDSEGGDSVKLEQAAGIKIKIEQDDSGALGSVRVGGEQRPAMKKCGNCCEKVLSSAYAEHVAKCVSGVHAPVSVKVPPIAATDRGLATFLKSYTPTEIGDALRNVVMQPKFFNGFQCRVGHAGFMRGFGWCQRTRNPFKGSKSLERDPKFAILASLIENSTLMLGAPALVKKLMDSAFFPNYVVRMPSINIQDKYSANWFLSLRYSSAPSYHSPPPCLAKILKCPSCHDTCEDCRQRGCVACGQCCLHTDKDRSLTHLTLHQPSETPAEQQVWFILGDKPLKLAGGLSLLFSGSEQPHGTWAPFMAGIEDAYSWVGCAIVEHMR